MMSVKTTVNKANEVKGYSLFKDIEDKALRIRNRGVIMANITEDGCDKGKISVAAARTLFEYLAGVPLEEREETNQAFRNALKERGFALTINEKVVQ